MPLTRRELLAAAALLPASRALAFIPEKPSPKAIADAALLAAQRGGATYADARLVRYRRQNVATRDDHMVALSDEDSYGLGVRVLRKGAWRFSATPDLTPESARAAAQKALALAEARAARAGGAAQ